MYNKSLVFAQILAMSLMACSEVKFKNLDPVDAQQAVSINEPEPPYVPGQEDPPNNEEPPQTDIPPQSPPTAPPVVVEPPVVDPPTLEPPVVDPPIIDPPVVVQPPVNTNPNCDFGPDPVFDVCEKQIRCWISENYTGSGTPNVDDMWLYFDENGWHGTAWIPIENCSGSGSPHLVFDVGGEIDCFIAHYGTRPDYIYHAWQYGTCN